VNLSDRRNPQSLLADDHQAIDGLFHALIASLDEANTVTIFNRLDFFWARLAMHIRAENLHVFPALLALVDRQFDATEQQSVDIPKLSQALDKLLDDHDFFMNQLAEAVQIMREVLSNEGSNQAETLVPVRQIIDAVHVRLNSHNRLEEEMIYGLPAKLLPLDAQVQLAGKIQHELENLPRRFAKVAR
jgi:hypothetical protein